LVFPAPLQKPARCNTTGANLRYPSTQRKENFFTAAAPAGFTR
jgi:hypothetical protein